MNAPEFSIDLGGGVFVDSNGTLRTGAIPDKPKFKIPGGLPVKPEVMKKALDSLGQIVPHIGDPNIGSKLLDLGVSSEVFQMLGKIANLVSFFAKFAGVAGFAADVLLSFLQLNKPDEGLKHWLQLRFDELNARAKNTELKTRLDDTAKDIAKFSHALTSVEKYVKLVQNPYFDEAQVAALLQDIRGHQSDLSEKLEEMLLNQWLFTFEATEYYWYAGRVEKFLHAVKADGSLEQRGLPGNLALEFDHRPMIGLLSYGLQTYLTVLRSMSPEFRTTGEFATELRKFAGYLDSKLTKLRETCLVRTYYREGDWIPVANPLPAHQRPPFPGMLVGAFDLREFTDSYINGRLDATTGRAATIQTRWQPPAGTPQGSYDTFGAYYFLSKEQAALANAAAEQEYMDLLVTSGFMNLAHVASLLRHIATEPPRSQTVDHAVSRSRFLDSTATVEVTSEIAFSDPIKTQGRRELFESQFNVNLTTQPLRRQVPIEYSIMLRTLPMGGFTKLDVPYETYSWTDYEPLGSLDQRLAVHTSSGMEVAQHQIDKSASPKQPRIFDEKTVQLKAYTFDYLISVPDPAYVDEWNQGIALMRSYGWTPTKKAGVQPAKLLTYTGGSPKSMVSEFFEAGPNGLSALFSSIGEVPQGERRNVESHDVTVTYKLQWHADQAWLTLKTKPVDRNYVVYVVVEEKLGSGQLLHTAVKIEVFGQLTYVSESFFRREHEARVRAATIFSEFQRKYAISVGPGPRPPGPVEAFRPGVLSNEELNLFAATARQHQPALLERVLIEEQMETAAGSKAKTG